MPTNHYPLITRNRRLPSNFSQHAFHRRMERSVHRAAASACVAAAAKLFSDVRHIEFAFAPQAHAKSSIRKFPEENCNFHIADRERVIDQAFAILFLRAHTLHLLLRDPYPGERAFTLQGRKRGAEQPQFRRRVPEINVPRAERRISPRHHQFARQLKGVLVGSFEHESARVGEYGGIEAGRYLGREFYSRRSRQAINKLSRGHGLGIDPVQISKIAAALVMVDIDQEIFFQTLQARALHVIAFEQNGSVIIAIHPLSLNHSLSERQLLIYTRNAVAKDDLRLFSQTAQNFTAGKRRANRVTVRPRVRRQNESLALRNLLENLVDHAQCGGRPSTRRPPRPPYFLFARFNSSSTRA